MRTARQPSGPGRKAQEAPLRVSVIIPVLDEEARIREQLASLADTAALHEVIVVDGGSSDRTASLARGWDGVQVLESARGRARQMNAGAAVATGEVLLFLHADVRLPSDAIRWIRDTLAAPGVIAGAFRTWTVPDGADARTWLAPLLHLADLRSRYSSLPYGDQALFLRRDVFQRAGGFPDLPLMEDLALSRRLRRMGRITTVAANVMVSGRRFLDRPIYYPAIMNIFPLLYRLGVPAGALAAFYKQSR